MVIPQLILSGVFVNFDKMNPDVSSVSGVPFYGNVVTARWAFEALAVNQFCYNDYETLFYVYDKSKSQCTYYKDYWVPAMRSYLNRVSNPTPQLARNPEEINRLFALLQGEIERNAHMFPDIAPPRSDLFAAGLFGQAAYNLVNNYLEDIRKYSMTRYNKTDMALDRFRRQFSAYYLDSLRMECHNTSIEDLVTSTSDKFGSVIVEYNGRLWQKNDLVFQDSEDAFSAPLYMPHKTLWGMRIDTYVFDILMIWILNAILFLVLISGRLSKWMLK